MGAEKSRANGAVMQKTEINDSPRQAPGFCWLSGNNNIALAGTGRNIANFLSVLIAEDVVP